MAWDDPDEDESEAYVDPEDPDESDMDGPNEPETMECPWCGKMVHEQSEWCHHCGKYLSGEDAPRKIPAWVMVGTLMALATVMGGILIWLVEKIVNR